MSGVKRYTYVHDMTIEHRDSFSLYLRNAESLPDGYRQLIEHAVDRLYALTRRMLRAYPHLRRWEQTDDVFQIAAMRLYRSLESVRPDSAARFWGLAGTQIRRTLIDLARHHFGPEGIHSKYRSDVLELTGTEEGDLTETDSTRRNTSLSIEDWVLFHQTVDALPVEEREVVELIWYGDLSQPRVADELRISLRTVKRRWRSARLKLAEVLEKEVSSRKVHDA